MNQMCERISLTILVDGQVHDLSNLLSKAPKKCEELYPERRTVLKVRDIDSRQVMGWKPIPSAPVFRPSTSHSNMPVNLTGRRNEESHPPEFVSSFSMPIARSGQVSGVAVAASSRPKGPKKREPRRRPKVDYSALYSRSSSFSSSKSERRLEQDALETIRDAKPKSKPLLDNGHDDNDGRVGSTTLFLQQSHAQLQQLRQRQPQPQPQQSNPKPKRQEPLLDDVDETKRRAVETILLNCQETVTVAPDMTLPFIGEEQTHQAMIKDACTVATCFGCTQRWMVIHCAHYVLCPECQTISPLTFCQIPDRRYVGMGITRDGSLSNRDCSGPRRHAVTPRLLVNTRT